MGILVSKKPRMAAEQPGISSRAAAIIPDNIPSKIFIEKKAEYEYTDMEPAARARLSALLDGYYSQANFLELFHCLPEIFAPIHEIASRVADAKWELRKVVTDDVDYKDESFNRLFSKPNPFNNIQQLVYMSVAYYLLTGRQFWSINRPTVLENKYQNILSWFSLPAPHVYVKQKQTDIYTCTKIDDVIEGYQLKDNVNGNKGRTFEPGQVIPFVNFSLQQLYDFNKNNSPLLGAEKAIKNLIPVYEARGTIYIKRGAMGFIVSRKSDDSGSVALSAGETDQLLKDYNKTYGVSNDKSNVGITGQPIDFVSIGMSIKDLMPFDETLSDAIAIYATLRVPRHLVPSKDQGTFSNVEVSMKAFYDDVIIPLATMFAESWTNGMGFDLQRKYIYPSYEHIDILQENKKLKAEVDKLNADTAILLYKEGMITKNERNGMIGAQTMEDGNTYVSDEKNNEALANKLTPATLAELMKVVTNVNMDPGTKLIVLSEFFKIPKKVATQIHDMAIEAKAEADAKAEAEAEALAQTNNFNKFKN
jgi:phage portal protein BeeE